MQNKNKLHLCDGCEFSIPECEAKNEDITWCEEENEDRIIYCKYFKLKGGAKCE